MIRNDSAGHAHGISGASHSTFTGITVLTTVLNCMLVASRPVLHTHTHTHTHTWYELGIGGQAWGATRDLHSYSDVK